MMPVLATSLWQHTLVVNHVVHVVGVWWQAHCTSDLLVLRGRYTKLTVVLYGWRASEHPPDAG